MNIVGSVLKQLEMAILATLLFGTVLVVAYGVLTRYVLVDVDAIGWPEAAVRLCLVWICFWGSAVVLREKRHFVVDILIARFGRKTQISFKIVQYIIMLVFCITLLTDAIPLTRDQMAFFFGAMDWPLGIQPLSLVVGGILMAIYLVIGLITSMQELLKHDGQ